jgi:hypothetical protein
LRHQVAVHFVLGSRRTTFFFSAFRIKILFRFADDLKTDWQRNTLAMVQASHKVNPFDGSLLTMVIVPANNIVLVCVGFLADAIINDHDAIVPLDFADMGFGDAP